MATTDDYTSDKTTTGILAAGGKATGLFEQRGDSDWFRVSLAANSYYTFKLDVPGQTGYYYSNFSLSLVPPSGGIVSSLQSNATATAFSATFKTGTAGDYYINLSNLYGPDQTAYAINATAGAADLVGDTMATASSLTLNQAVSSAFEGPSDTDLYKVSLTAGVSYTIKPTWLAGGSPSGNMSVSVADAAGQHVNIGSSNDVYSFTAAATGSYYITTRGSSGSDGTASGYTLLLAPSPDDYAASAAGAGRVVIGTPTKGKLDAVGDKDWFAVSLNANTTYWFSAKADSTGGYNSSSTQLKLYDAASQVVASQSGSNSETVMQFRATKAGTYYFEVGDTSTYYTGNYVASAVIGADDYGNDQVGAASIAVGSTVSGKLELASDKDVFKFAVKAGTTYTFELKTQNSVGSTGLFMSGVDGSGSTNGQATYSKAGATDYRVYTANYTGDFYLTVDNNYNSGTAGYTLQVNTPAGDDFAASSATTGLLAVGGKVTGALNYVGDSDWIKVKLVAGASYAFVLEGKASGAGTLDVAGSDVQLGISSAAGYGGYLNTMSGVSGKGYTYTASATGDHYLHVGPPSYYYVNAQAGSYAVSAHSLSGDKVMPTMVSFAPASGSTGASLTGKITLTFDDLMRTGDSHIRLIDAEGDVVETFGGSSSRLQMNGNVLTIDPSYNLQPGTKYTLELPAGSLLDYAGNKFLADKVYSFTTLDTVAQGGSGNDFLSGIGTNVRLSGGEGVDVAVYGSSYSYYAVTRGAIESKVLYQNGGSLGSGDTLTGVERLMFSDRSIALDTDGNGGQAYRLYQATFNRTPDKEGLGFWMAQLDNGMSLKAVAESFLTSPEFQALYGVNNSNEAFIDNLYRNVLHRAGDADGIKYWNEVLGSGTTRAEVLTGFSESAEYRAEILKLIGNGFEYTPYG